eukprot:TRINITY_DN57215_c0_g1_i1.p1 TRINITY_DN57215_c0_g1~~TRINITY_DN57215_c0_g1_i1.p1  ORF type:complete len:374 (-),score=47.91 TRINITY_DN57215_c0_g1_i1:124-1245(-)
MGANFSFDKLLEGHCHDFSERNRERSASDLICYNEDASEYEADFDETYETTTTTSLGSGKFSTVHICFRRDRPEKKYAMKIIDSSIGGAASMSQIGQEIEIMELLGHHDHIVQLIEADQTMPGHIRLVLDLCEGGDLFDRIQQKNYFPENDCRACIRNLLAGVAYVHSKRIMHRDMKPENILLVSRDNDTNVKVSDFGLAKISRDSKKLPRSTTICGSDFYLAPELIMQEEYGREIDIWAIGVITYITLSGSLPFYNSVLHKLYRKIVERDLGFSEPSWKQVSKGAQDFILRVLQIRPGDRLTAADALNHPWLYDARRNSRSNSASGTSIGMGAPSAASMAHQEEKIAQVVVPRTAQSGTSRGSSIGIPQRRM